MREPSESATVINSLVRRYLARCHLLKLATGRHYAQRQATRRQRGLDILGQRSLALIQRVGRGLRGRKNIPKHLVERRAIMLATQRLLPLGYKIAQTPEERESRLKAVLLHTKMLSAVSIQRWWRRTRVVLRSRLHEKRLRALVELNRAALVLQRWWRCVSSRRLYLPMAPSRLQNFAEELVSTEELALQRSSQMGSLIRRWESILSPPIATFPEKHDAVQRAPPAARRRAAAHRTYRQLHLPSRYMTDQQVARQGQTHPWDPTQRKGR